MINHARTLLMNVHPKRADYSDIGASGYEYIPVDFVPIRTPSFLTVIRKVLFGTNPDALFCGIRAKELLTYIHETEFADYLYAFDKRVTYWPEIKETKQQLDKPKIVITQVTGEPRRLIPTGVFKASVSAGVSYKNYSVLLTQKNESPADFFVRVKMLEPPRTETTVQSQNFPVQPIALPHNDVSVRILNRGTTQPTDYLVTENVENIVIEYFTQNADNVVVERPTDIMAFTTDNETVIARWEVATQGRPQDAISTLIPILEMLGEPVFLELFGVKPSEPYATFKNLWFDHPLPAYRLVGLTLAVIYRMEEARKNG